MLYEKLSSSDIFNIAKFGCQSILLEIDDDGFVIREIGLDKLGNVCHIFPGKGKYGDFGIFDLSPFDITTIENNFSAEEFDKVWNDKSNELGLR